MDERLPQDRKSEFAKGIARLRGKYPLEVLPAKMEEAEFLTHLQSHPYTLILLPWHRYLSWKKLEHHFGTLRLEWPTTVAGYFADALLPFELPDLPSCHRLLLLDFWRSGAGEIEIVEFQKRILVKYVASHPELSLKESMRLLWPPKNHENPALHGLIKHSDFLRIAHFPESNQLELTAFFIEANPTILHPGEVRGLWIEPQKLKFLKTSAELGYQKLFPVVGSTEGRIALERGPLHPRAPLFQHPLSGGRH